MFHYQFSAVSGPLGKEGCLIVLVIKNLKSWHGVMEGSQFSYSNLRFWYLGQQQKTQLSGKSKVEEGAGKESAEFPAIRLNCIKLQAGGSTEF